VGTGFFSSVNFFDAFAGPFQDFRIAKVIVDEDISALDAFASLQGEQKGIAGAGSNEKTNSM
jgi:hypothetical protein